MDDTVLIRSGGPEDVPRMELDGDVVGKVVVDWVQNADSSTVRVRSPGVLLRKALVTEAILDPLVRESLAAHAIVAEVLPCDPGLADTAAFCEHYGFAMEQAANTILVASKKVDPPRYAVCVVLGTTRLDVNQKVRELLGVKRLSFADAETTREVTGMMIGGVTAFGIPDLPIYVDSAVLAQERVVMGGGNRSSKLLLAPGELTKLPHAVVVDGLAKAGEPGLEG